MRKGIAITALQCSAGGQQLVAGIINQAKLITDNTNEIRTRLPASIQAESVFETIEQRRARTGNVMILVIIPAVLITSGQSQRLGQAHCKVNRSAIAKHVGIGTKGGDGCAGAFDDLGLASVNEAVVEGHLHGLAEAVIELQVDFVR